MTFTRTRIAWTVGVLLLLVIAAAVLLAPRLLGEARIRGEAERRLSEALGRPVTIRGPIRIDAGPKTRIDASDVTIAGGFAGAPPLLVLGRVQASVETASLLTGAPAIGEVRLDAPRIHLHVDRDGRTNWSGLGGGGTGEDAAAPATWSVAGLTIERGELRYTDARSGTDLSLHDWQLQAGRVALPEPFDLQTGFDARRGDAPLARVRLRTRVTADPVRDTYALHEADVDAELVREAGALPVTLVVDRLEYQGAAGTAGVRGLRVTTAGLALRVDGTASQLAGPPVVDAALAVEPFAPREVLRALGTAAPPMAGPGALERARLSARVNLRDGEVRISSLDAQLDDTRLTGTATVATAAPHRSIFDLAADRIVADRYLKPATPRDDSPVVLPLEFLRGLDVEGRLQVAELVAGGVTLRGLAIDLGAEARRAPVAAERDTAAVRRPNAESPPRARAPVSAPPARVPSAAGARP
jgi:AsmA protein